MQEVSFKSGQTLLLCSDGLYGALDDATLQILLSGPGELEAIADRLVQSALERNGSDNITAVLVRAD